MNNWQHIREELESEPGFSSWLDTQESPTLKTTKGLFGDQPLQKTKQRMYANAIFIDEDDINFLQQLPARYWIQALQLRYGKILGMSTDNKGNVKPDWRDTQQLTFPDGPRTVIFTINTGTSKLVKRLKEKGVTLERTSTNLYNQLMARDIATSISTKLRHAARGLMPLKAYESDNGYIWKQLQNPNIQPNTVRWIPNLTKGSRSLPKNTNQWEQAKEYMKKEIQDLIKHQLKTTSNPSHWTHINYFWWNRPEKLQVLTSEILEYLRPFANHYKYKTTLRQKIWQFIITKMQHGYINPLVLKKYLEQGINLNHMLYEKNPATGKVYTPQEIAEMVYEKKHIPRPFQSVIQTLDGRKLYRQGFSLPLPGNA